MNRIHNAVIQAACGLRAMGARVLAGLVGFVVPGIALADRAWNFQPPVTPIAKEIFELHAIIFWICVVIFIVVFGAMFYSIYAHRKSKGHVAAQFHENTTVEIIWTVIPFVILMLMAWPATKTIISMKDSSASDLTIKVTGSQWKWNYDYLNDGFGFYSQLSTPFAQMENREPKGEHYLLEVDHPLVVPVNKKIRLLITSSDVIHAWFLPAGGIQQDAIPGFVRDDWMKFDETGTFRGQCAKICGKDHGFMPIVVEVKSEKDYAAWAAEQKKAANATADDPTKVWAMADLMAQRRKGLRDELPGLPPSHRQGRTAGIPRARRVGGRERTEGGADSTVLNGVSHDGKPTAMIAWKDTLSNLDIAAVVTYERNSWGNHTARSDPARRGWRHQGRRQMSRATSCANRNQQESFRSTR